MSSSPTSITNNRSRVKLYTLNDERQWDDRGTGFVTCLSPTNTTNYHSIIVKSEIDGTTLLESQIQLHTKYQKQQETLIVWSEGENYDLALSFQEKIGCDDVWENICHVQGKDSSSGYQNSNNDGPSDAMIYESDDDCPIDSNKTYLSSNVYLPTVDLTNLAELTDCLSSEKIRDASRRDLYARAIESGNYIGKLIDLFHICEDSENLDALHQLYEIFRSIIYLNKSSLFDILFSEEMIHDVIGCLEYEPHLTCQTKRNHREFLKTKATFKEVIPIGNQELLAKIHQTYRVQYIQDVILPAPSLFEENLLSTMNNFLYFNKVEIVTLLYENPKFLSQLFSTLRDEQLSDEKRKDLMLFLKEFCVFSQTLQQQNRDHFFQALATHGILNVIQVVLNLDDTITKQAALDVFASIVECNPSTVREYMLQETQSIQDDDELLLNLVITEIRSDPDPELAGALHLMNHLKLLIDPDNMLAVSISERTEFLSFFYLRSMSVLVAPLMANTIDYRLTRDDFHQAQIENYILDFLTFCLEHHTYHMRNYLNKKDVLRRILVLVQSKHQFLQLSALRFLRKLIGLKDEQYHILIVRNNLLAPIVEAFKANKRRYNLLNSAMIELFEFIRLEDISCLINYFIDHFYSDFQKVTYVKTFQGLKSRYDAYHDRRERLILQNSPTSSNSCRLTTNHLLSMERLRKDPRDFDVDEEPWLSLDVDEQPTSSIHSTRLFNSISDDDDNDNEDDDDDDDDAENQPPEISTSAIATSEPSSRSDEDDEEMNNDRSPSYHSKPMASPSRLAMSPALSNIADQYNDPDDDDQEEKEDEQEEQENEGDEQDDASDDISSLIKKRPMEDEGDREKKIFKAAEESSSSSS